MSFKFNQMAKIQIKTRASALTETNILYTDGYTEGQTHRQMDTQTDRQADSSIPAKTFVLRRYNDTILGLFSPTILYNGHSLVVNKDSNTISDWCSPFLIG